MRLAGAVLLLFLPLEAAAQARPLPIIDMHLHAKEAPDPPGRLCLPVTVYGVIDPACSEPLLAPLTNEQMVERTVRILKTRNIFGVISGHTLETVSRFQKAAPDRLIPAYQLNLGHDSLPVA